MKVCIASYSFHGLFHAGMVDVFGYLETCKYRYNLQAADIWCDLGEINGGMLPSLDNDFLTKVKEALEERELELANLCVDGTTLWEDDPGDRESNYHSALAHLKAAEFLGAKTVRFNSGGHGDTFTNEQFDLIVKRFKEYAQIAYDHGFKVGPENHWGPENNPENMKRICEAVDSQGFGVLLHVGKYPGDDVMAPWAMHTHFSWDAAHTNLAETMTMLRDSGYQGYYAVEHHSAYNEYINSAIQLAKIQKVLREW